MSELLVGVDLGTTGTKAALYSPEGEALAESTAETPLRWRGPGEVDQDPDDFYAAAVRAIRDCVERSGTDPASVAAIGVTGQMAGVLGIDGEWRPATPYDSWLDLRCSPDVEALGSALGSRLVELSGCPAMVNHGPKMRWWRREHPEAFEAVAKFVVPSGYVAGRLAGLAAGEAFMDHSYLHFTGVADARAGDWSEELAEAVGVPIDKLPRIVDPASQVGELRAGGGAGVRPRAGDSDCRGARRHGGRRAGRGDGRARAAAGRGRDGGRRVGERHRVRPRRRAPHADRHARSGRGPVDLAVVPVGGLTAGVGGGHALGGRRARLRRAGAPERGGAGRAPTG